MKKLYTFLTVASLCFLMLACSDARNRLEFLPSNNLRTDAVVDITEISRSTTQFPEEVVAVTSPQYFEVVAISTTAKQEETTQAPAVTEAPKEFYTVKFVDIDGYSTISVQSIEEGKSATEPPMPSRRDDLIFLGWDKDFSTVNNSMIVKAIYQKEWLTVRFLDVNSTLLKSEQVMYLDDATPPLVEAPEGYTFAGWSASYESITEDTDIYATYSLIPVRNFTPLTSAYKFLPVTENTLKFSKSSYFRKEHAGICTIQEEDYAGNIIYGRFSDTIDISGFGFTSFEGKVGLKMQTSNVNNIKYSVKLHIYLNDVLEFYTEVSQTDTFKEFALPLNGIDTITIHLELYQNDSPCNANSDFIGGLIDAVLYEN